jgi:hypothetical protein
MRSADPRLYVGARPLLILGRLVLMVPAAQAQLALLRFSHDPENQIPAIRLFSAADDHGLEFIPTVEECEAFGQALLDQARIQRERAAAQAEAQIQKARNL